VGVAADATGLPTELPHPGAERLGVLVAEPRRLARRRARRAAARARPRRRTPGGRRPSPRCSRRHGRRGAAR
jgi:hypothetical protein